MKSNWCWLSDLLSGVLMKGGRDLHEVTVSCVARCSCVEWRVPRSDVLRREWLGFADVDRITVSSRSPNQQWHVAWNSTPASSLIPGTLAWLVDTRDISLRVWYKELVVPCNTSLDNSISLDSSVGKAVVLFLILLHSEICSCDYYVWCTAAVPFTYVWCYLRYSLSWDKPTVR